MTRDELHKLNVVVLSGGWSDEREISMDSGRACMKALREAGFEHVTLLDVADEGFVKAISEGGYDVAFVAMHGRYGEDGCIQGFLEILHIPHTFSGVLGSSAGTEKDVSKLLYQTANIPCPRGTTLAPGKIPSMEESEFLVGQFGLPLQHLHPAGPPESPLG